MSNNNPILDDIIYLHQEVHEQYREAIAELNDDALNWTPGPDTSSIGTIIVHALGSGAEALRLVLQMPTNRDRDGEFAARDHRLGSLLGSIEAAEAEWQSLAPGISADRLRANFARPNRDETRSGYYWLIRNYGHMREHLAQLWFTKQLYERGRDA